MMLLGAIADDLTGATDLALMLARGGMRTIQVNGVPAEGFDFAQADAVIVALKSRTIAPADAVSLSLGAAQWLVDGGAQQLFFKYCSTFDSTDQGNIGPVINALLEFLGEEQTVACPAFPVNRRTVYRGHLFVGDQLLSDSPMKDHPLTPMRDANLVRVLQRQTQRKVGLVSFDTIEQGAEAIRGAFEAAASVGEKILILDAVTETHLRDIGIALAGAKLITGGSGIGLGLPENYRRTGQLIEQSASTAFSAPVGRSVILAGSCSTATRRQVNKAIDAGLPTLRVDPVSIASGSTTAESVVDWVISQHSATPIVYSSTDPAEVLAAQQELGVERAGALVERLLGGVAASLRSNGFRRFLVAGGETSGAVVAALKVQAMLIGPEIDPGVPWTLSVDEGQPIALALKSGNFGSDDFFIKAWTLIE